MTPLRHSLLHSHCGGAENKQGDKEGTYLWVEFPWLHSWGKRVGQSRVTAHRLPQPKVRREVHRERRLVWGALLCQRQRGNAPQWEKPGTREREGRGRQGRGHQEESGATASSLYHAVHLPSFFWSGLFSLYPMISPRQDARSWQGLSITMYTKELAKCLLHVSFISSLPFPYFLIPLFTFSHNSFQVLFVCLFNLKNKGDGCCLILKTTLSMKYLCLWHLVFTCN